MGFSMSFLDLLTCGLGAMLLLFILSEQSQREEIQAQRANIERIDAVIEQIQVEGGPTDYERLAAWSEAAAKRVSHSLDFEQAGSEVAGQMGLHGAAKRLLILVDISGSMSRYYPDTEAFASLPGHLRAAGPKWHATQQIVSELLLQAVSLDGPGRGFRIHRLSDNLAGREVSKPIYPTDADADVDAAWAPADTRHIAAAQRALAAVTPEGGSNHYAALAHALDCSTAARTPLLDSPADTLVIITDGLPNHGPVSLPGHPEHPDAERMPRVPGVSRLDRKRQVIERLYLPRLAEAADVPTVHVIVMPWPDDTTMMQFALELAAPTAGSVVAAPVPVETREGPR